MEEWKSILCLWFTALLLLAATVDGQKQQSLEKSSSASDEVGTNFSGGFHGRHGRNRFGKLSDSEESGVYKVEECLGGMGMMDTARIEPKVCDMDNLLGRGEKDLIKIALRELETVTSQHIFDNKHGGIKLAVLLMKNIKDEKETDEKIFDSVKRHLLVNPFDRVAVIVLTVNADYRDQQQRQQQTWMTIIDRRLNTPVYYYFAQSGVWSNFYSSANLNTVAVSPSEVVQLYNNEAPLLRQGTFGVALLDIIHGIRDKALMKQQTWMNTDRTTLAQVRLPFNRQQPSTSLDLDARLIGGNSDEVYKIERCLQHVEAKVCDFDGMLTSGEQMQIDSALSDLEYATASRFGQQQIISSRFGEGCQNGGGIKLATIVIKDVQSPESVDQKINEMLNRWTMANPCDRAAVLMLSTGSSDYYRTGGGGQRFLPNSQTQQMGGRSFYYQQQQQQQFPTAAGGVWSKFYGISNLNVPMSPSDIVQIYSVQKPLIRQGQYTQALWNIIRGLKTQVLTSGGGRFTRDTEFEAQGSDVVTTTRDEKFGGERKQIKLTEVEKQKMFGELDKCLQEIKPDVCDPFDLISDDEEQEIENTLRQLEKETTRPEDSDPSKKKGFIVAFVMLPFTDDITEYEKKINSYLAHWRENHHHDRVAVMMLSAQKSDVYGRSKFYGTSTRDALVRPNELVQLYNNNKPLIRSGKHGEALHNIAKKIQEMALRHE